MTRTRIYELAKEWGVASKAILAQLRKIGSAATTAHNIISTRVGSRDRRAPGTVLVVSGAQYLEAVVVTKLFVGNWPFTATDRAEIHAPSSRVPGASKRFVQLMQFPFDRLDELTIT